MVNPNENEGRLNPSTPVPGDGGNGDGVARSQISKYSSSTATTKESLAEAPNDKKKGLGGVDEITPEYEKSRESPLDNIGNNRSTLNPPPGSAFSLSPSNKSVNEKLLEDDNSDSSSSSSSNDDSKKKDKKKSKKDKKSKKKGKKGDEEEKKEKSPLEDYPSIPFLQLYRFADLWDRIMIAVGTFMAVLVGVASPMLILVFGGAMGDFINYTSVMNQYLSAPDKTDPAIVELKRRADHNLDHSTRQACWNFLAIGLGVWAAGFLMSVCFNIAAERQTERIRSLYYRSILRQNIAWFDKIPTGDLTSRISGDVQLIHDGFGEKVGYVIQFIAMFVAGLAIAFAKAWSVALVVCAILPFMVISVGIMGVVISKLATKSQDQYAGAGAVANEVLSSIRTIMAFNSQERELERYDKEIVKAYNFSFKKGIISGVCIGFMMFTIFAAYCLGFWFGSTRIWARQFDAGQVMTAFFSLLIGGFSLGGAAPNITHIATGRGCASRVYGIIGQESPIDSVDDSRGIKVNDIEGSIEFRNINFAYPTRTDIPILRNFSLSIKAGEKVALVGGSGCGKSTTVSLVERFYDPDEGQVLVDGIDVKEYNVRSLRQQLGMVTQEPVLFSTTIYQNIVWGAVDPETDPPTKEHVIAAAQAANAHSFISRLPDGYDTVVGEGGALLSGGQKQRIAIARALIRNPKILLLDEATSALDTESERLVQDALDRLSRSRTTITIAHRLSTIRSADRICVIREGQVLESGSHDELVMQGGEYAAMVKAQELRQKAREKVVGKAEEDDVDIERLVAEEIDRTKSIARRTSTHQTIKSINDEDKGGLGKFVITKPGPKRERSFGKLWNTFWENKKDLPTYILGILGAAVDGAVFPAFSVVFSKLMIVFGLTDEHEFKSQSRLYSLLFLAFGGISFIGMTCRVTFFTVGSEKLTRKIRYLSFKALLRQEAGFFDDENNGTGALTAKLATEAESINKVGTLVWPATVGAVSAIATGIIISFISDWRMSLIIIACLPFVVFAEYFQTQAMEGTSKGASKAQQEAGQAAAETIANIKTVASLTREHTFIAIFDEYNSEPYKNAVNSSYLSAFGYGFSQASMLLVYALAFFVGTRFVLNETLTMEDLFRVMFALMFSAYALGQLSQQATNYSNGLVAASDIYDLIHRETAIDSTSDNGASPEKFTGKANLQDVEFAYPIRPKAKILHGISLEANPGQTVALVGGSGSGKSTTVALLQRLYDVSEGGAFVEDIDVRDWNIRSLRDHISIVSQEPTLFGMSIAENISYGRTNATVQEIESAARDANIYDFIQDLPDGLNTNVGQKGGQLSGGQKQRIAIARAMIRNPKLLLLDEATSALDSKSEKVVQAVLDKAKLGRTTITIAHRLSTIQDSDLIVVFQRGNIVEKGTHDDLLMQNGVYAGLVQQQSLEVTH
ncbi:hypothetical protein H4219_001018 [Mycoemilia scoparia]|uniref:Uncharacterized protein n=1 Tax=Mycoemilia scoparia TaxID=417184 RepID=A0A9W8A9G1_9FUNG|nr:hypothetical protein H4219_001018 [Mycoemilia scoparia]